MPIIEQSDILQTGPVGIMQQPEEKDHSFFGEVVPAAFRTENLIGSIASKESNRSAPYDKNFNPFSDLGGYEEHAMRFVDTNTAEEVGSVKKQIDREKADRRILAESGGYGFVAQLAAGILDPINLVPVGGQAYKAYRIGSSVIGGGYRAARAGLLASTAVEVGLQGTQETRSIEESAVNIGTATFLSGVLGGSMSAFRHSVEARGVARLYDKSHADLAAKNRNPEEAVEVALHGLENDLEKVMVDAGAVAKDVNGNPKLKQNGEYKLSNNYGITKVIVKHGVEGPDARDPSMSSYVVGKSDVTAIPSVFRKFEGVHDEDLTSGLKRWTWAVDRKGEDGSTRQVVYIVRRFMNGDNKDHVVTVYAPMPGEEFPYSKKRHSKLSASLQSYLRIDGDTGEELTVSTSSQAEVGAPINNIHANDTNVTQAKNAAWGEALERVEKDLASTGEEGLDALGDDPDINIRVDDGGSVGAASAKQTTSLEQEGLKSAMWAEKILKFQDPVLRLANSPSKVARQMNEALAEQPLLRNKNTEGIASEVAVETLQKMHQAKLYRGMKSLDSAFIEYRSGKTDKFAGRAIFSFVDETGIFKTDQKLDIKEFKSEVSAAMRRGDKHEIPEVQKAAQTLRKEVFDPLRKDAEELGLLPEDVEVGTADSYLMRMWDHEKIVAKRDKVQNLFTRYLIGQREKAIKRIEDAQSRIEGLEKKKELEGVEVKELAELQLRLEVDRYRAGFEDIELHDRSGEIIDRILGTPDGRLPYDLSGDGVRGADKGNHPDFRGPLRRRAFQIPDHLVEEFLENDIELISQRYVRSMSTDVEMARKFGKDWLDASAEDISKGDLRLTPQLQKLRDEYDRLIANAADDKGRIKLQKQKVADFRDVSAIRDRLLGKYAPPADPNSWFVRGGRILRNWNYLRLLGGMTLSATPDPGRIVMVHGFERTLRDGVKPFVQNIRAAKIAAEEVRLAGAALDMVLDSRTMAIADIMDDFGRHTKFERGLHALTSNFGIVSLMAPWNAALKQAAGLVTMRRMLDAVDAVSSGKIDPREMEKLASQGIDADMAMRIHKQFKNHGQIDGDLKLPMTENWADRKAVEVLRAGMLKEIDRTIVTPGQDKPLWISKETGKLLGQFKSFGLASTQRTLLAGLQQRDMAAFNGAAMMLGLGAITYGLKSKAAGKETSDDYRVWMAEGVDRSGLTGWLFEANNMLEKATRGNAGVNAMIGGPPMSRYASRSATEAILGPSFGTVADMFTVTGAVTSGDTSKSDVKAIRRLLPYQNLFYLRQLFDKVEENTASALGAD